MLSIADSTAILADYALIDDSDPSDVQLLGPTLGAYYDLCDDERFFSQPTPGFCSGTLIAPDLILTAGHCMNNPNGCAGTVFVFNYHMVDSVALEPITVDDIFACQSIVAH